MCYNTMQQIKVNIKSTILSRTLSDNFHPKFVDSALNLITAKRNLKPEVVFFSNKKLSVNTASTPKREGKEKLNKSNIILVKICDLPAK